MGWGYCTYNGVPTMRTYADAAEHEAKVEPIRGCKTSLKPLGNRRSTWRAIRRESDDRVVISAHGNDIMTFYPDDTIRLTVRHRGRPSTTYNNLVRVVLNVGWYYAPFVRSGHAWMRLRWREEGKTYDTTSALQMSEEGLLIKYDPSMRQSTDYPTRTIVYANSRDPAFICLNPTLPKRVGIDRKKASALRARPEYAQARQYITAFLKLVIDPNREGADYFSGGGAFSGEAYGEAFGWKTDSTGKVMSDWRGRPIPEMPNRVEYMTLEQKKELVGMFCSDDAAENHRAMLTLCRGHTITVKNIVSQFDTLLYIIHANDVLVEKPVATGKSFSDPLRKHFTPTQQH